MRIAPSASGSMLQDYTEGAREAVLKRLRGRAAIKERCHGRKKWRAKMDRSQTGRLHVAFQ